MGLTADQSKNELFQLCRLTQYYMDSIRGGRNLKRVTYKSCHYQLVKGVEKIVRLSDDWHVKKTLTELILHIPPLFGGVSTFATFDCNEYYEMCCKYIDDRNNVIYFDENDSEPEQDYYLGIQCFH